MGCKKGIPKRSTQHNSTARDRKARRSQRTAIGHVLPTDWECPRCSKWYSNRQNGPSNHLRFCLKSSHSSSKISSAKPLSLPKIINRGASEDDDSASSSSDSS